MARVSLQQLAARRGIRPDLSERVGRLAAALALELQARHQVTPAALAFGLRALSDPELAAELRLLGRLARQPAPAPLGALDFETRKARRLLRLAG